ncbi:hypothetical protein [Demequina aurantiaca]|uniref:hypothetical protein n=1 Tax=Demequina aurantiaca TaxID=676200 RepID=UPI000784B39B|nr:hypothetical protein [Demequina aurantiaca]
MNAPDWVALLSTSLLAGVGGGAITAYSGSRLYTRKRKDEINSEKRQVIKAAIKEISESLNAAEDAIRLYQKADHGSYPYDKIRESVRNLQIVAAVLPGPEPATLFEDVGWCLMHAPIGESRSVSVGETTYPLFELSRAYLSAVASESALPNTSIARDTREALDDIWQENYPE